MFLDRSKCSEWPWKWKDNENKEKGKTFRACLVEGVATLFKLVLYGRVKKMRHGHPNRLSVTRPTCWGVDFQETRSPLVTSGWKTGYYQPTNSCMFSLFLEDWFFQCLDYTFFGVKSQARTQNTPKWLGILQKSSHLTSPSKSHLTVLIS